MRDKINYLHVIDNIVKKRSKENMILKSTHYDFNLLGSVLDVKATRVFTNDSEHTIEAIMTFPVPVEASVYKLQYEKNGQVIEGVIRTKEKARSTYEKALDNGYTSLLHEELVKGIHMLSVGNIPSGDSVKVELYFSLLGQFINDNVEWRIPVTAGQIYGLSPFSPSDDIVIDYDNKYKATYTLESSAFLAKLEVNNNHKKKDVISLNKPIILRTEKDNITSLNFVELFNGESYTKYQVLEKIVKTNNPLNIAILCDISGSMTGMEDGHTRYELMKRSLLENSKFRQNDKIDIFAFSNSIKLLSGSNFVEKIQNLPAPSGGTQIGKCINEVINLGYKDILVITDGESYDINIQETAQRNVRISSLLVSENAFEATMGQLSILTGGQLLFANSNYVYALGAILKALRNTYISEYKNGIFDLSVGNNNISLKPVENINKDSFSANALSSIYGTHIMKFFNEDIAKKIAKKNHFVSYNTSLILVDKSVQLNGELPVTVKVGLPSNNVNFMMGANMMRSAPLMNASASLSCSSNMMFGLCDTSQLQKKALIDIDKPIDIYSLESQIDWSYINEYLKGDLNKLSLNVKDTIQKYINQNRGILSLKMKNMNIKMEIYVLSLIAQKSNNRNAQRFYEKLFA